MAAPIIVLIVGLSFLCAITHLPLHVPGSTTEGFSADLIHRDSPESPFYDPTSTPSSRLRAAFHRSATRVSYFRLARSLNSTSRPRPRTGIWSPITNHDFEFSMRFGIGSNEQEVDAIIDTSSSMIWVLGYPCHGCFKHHRAIFHPRSSKSYQKLQCNNGPPCSLLDDWSCDDDNNCKYYHDYVDGSFVRGIFSIDRFTFKQKAHVDNMYFGATHETFGSFNEKTIGMVGLGNGDFSLPRQLRSKFRKWFAYCLSLTANRGKILFGSAANISDHRAITTTLFIGDYYYSLKLVSLSVKGAEDRPPIIVKSNPILQRGNIIIDTGIRHTYIDEEAMLKLIELLVELIELPRKDMGPTAPPKNIPHRPPVPKNHPRRIPKVDFEEDEDFYDLCFNKTDAPRDIHLPDITFHFADGADVIMDKTRAFITIEKVNMLCLNLLASDDDVLTFGTYNQAGFLMRYDLDAEKLTIVPNHC